VKLAGRFSKEVDCIRMLKDPSYRVTHFDEPITNGIMLKHVFLRRMEILCYRHCSDGRISRIAEAGVDRDTLAGLQGGSIIVFFHQPFVHFVLPMLGANGVVINTLPIAPSVSKFKARLLKVWPQNYRRIPYRPVIALKKLMERLKAGDCVLLAADGRIGQHHLTVKFGNGAIKTPRGIYELSEITGAPIVPVLLRLRPFPSLPGFDLKVGTSCAIEKAPEEELEKIESLFSWYFGHLREQPYMWKRIADPRFALAPSPQAAS
jgi:hypothetical protein